MSLYFCEQLEVGRVGDDRRELRTSFRRLADLDDLHAVGLGVDLVPVRHELVVVRQEVVVTDVVAEKLLRRRDVALRADCAAANNSGSEATTAARQVRSPRIDIQNLRKVGRTQHRPGSSR